MKRQCLKKGIGRIQSINNECNLFHFQDSRKIDWEINFIFICCFHAHFYPFYASFISLCLLMISECNESLNFVMQAIVEQFKLSLI